MIGASRRRRGDPGQAGGAETIALGVLVLVGGLLVGVNAWSVFWTRGAADAIAREYLRAYTEAADAGAARRDGRAAADVVISARGLDPARVELHEPTAFVACASVELGVDVDVPTIRAPFLGSLGTNTVTIRHTERIDAYRAGPALPDSPGPPCPPP